MLDKTQHGRLPRVGEVGQLRGQTVRSHGVLREVIGTDGHEVEVRHDGVGHERCGGDLNHRTRGEVALSAQICEPLGFRRGSDHRSHDPGGSVLVTLSGGLRDGVELAGKKRLVVTGDTQTAHTESRVFLGLQGGVGNRLIRACVERTDNDLRLREGSEDLAVDACLLVNSRLFRRGQEGHLRAVEADAFCLRVSGDARGIAVCHIGQQLEAVAVLGLGRTGPLRHLGGALAVLRDGGLRGSRVSTEGHGTQRTVDEDFGARLDVAQLGAHGDDARDVELTRNDRGVRGRAAELGDERLDVGAVEGRGIGRREVIGEENGFALNGGQAGLRLAAQLCNNAVTHVLEVGRALSHDAARSLEHGNEFIGRADDGVFRVIAGVDVLTHGLVPAAVLDHAGGRVEHLSRVAFRARGAGLQATRDSEHGLVKAIEFCRGLAFGNRRARGRQCGAGSYPDGLSKSDARNDAGTFDSGLRCVFHAWKLPCIHIEWCLLFRSSQIGRKIN